MGLPVADNLFRNLLPPPLHSFAKLFRYLAHRRYNKLYTNLLHMHLSYTELQAQ
jgi:hypothetical protein